MIRQPVSSRVMLTERRCLSPSAELELELALDDPRLLDRALTELLAEVPEWLWLLAELLLEWAVTEPPVSATQLSSTLPSAL